MICRACTRECKDYKLLHVEGVFLGRVTTLADLLSFCTDLEISEEEFHLPAQLCLECVQKLAKSVVFKEMVIDANDALRRSYSTIEEMKGDLIEDLLEDPAHDLDVANISYTTEVNEILGEKFVAAQVVEIIETVTESEFQNVEEVCETVDIEVGEELEYETEQLENDETIVVDGEVHEVVEELLPGEGDDVKEEIIEEFVNDEDLQTINDAENNDQHDNEQNKSEEDDDSCDQEDNMAENKCDVCQKVLKNRKSYNLHMKRHDPCNPKACKFCGKVYRQLDTLRRHLLAHTGEKPLECEVCGRRFRFRSILAAHMRQHTGEKPFKCSHCDKSFGTRKHMKRHELVHLSTENSYQCDICDKSFSQERYLDLHKMRHVGEKPYQCHLCGKSVAQQGSLKRHMLTHTGEKPFQCDLCDKNFRDIKTLKIHKLHHAGIKPFECPYCEKNFSTGTQLKIHTMIHTGETPHACEICGKSYRVARSLQRHVLVHTGERNHICEVCGFKFRFQSNLVSHRRLHSRNDSKCPYCEKAFRTIKQRERHIATRHHEPKEDTTSETEVEVESLTDSNQSKSRRQNRTTRELVPEKVATSNIVMLY